MCRFSHYDSTSIISEYLLTLSLVNCGLQKNLYFTDKAGQIMPRMSRVLMCEDFN
jgi:hypothetical protein